MIEFGYVGSVVDFARYTTYRTMLSTGSMPSDQLGVERDLYCRRCRFPRPWHVSLSTPAHSPCHLGLPHWPSALLSDSLGTHPVHVSGGYLRLHGLCLILLLYCLCRNLGLGRDNHVVEGLLSDGFQCKCDYCKLVSNCYSQERIIR